MEPSQTKISTKKRQRTPSQEFSRKGRMQHREEELFPIRYDNTSTKRFHIKAKTNKKSAGLCSSQMGQRR